ncbi:SecY subunit domain-containing protein [Butyriboletus roseoflavus]|nr:SecY subunit domain-containing protein [Butyriboletus roseoflavus]KAG8221201.1 SecY subunit domain-containing protein [Butyriboletus roseoflavus]
MKEALLDPIYTTLHIAFVVSACALFSKTWIEISGSGPWDIAKKAQGSTDAYDLQAMTGHHEGSELKCVIPTAAAFEGAILGLMSVFADLMGAIGSGTGILMAVTIIYSYWEIGIRESGGTEMAMLGDLL